MSATQHEAALAVIKATSIPIHDMGTAAYLSPDIAGWAADWGWSNPFAFYFAGRGGMLGEVGPDVATSAFGWFEPTMVHAMFSEGVGVAGATGAAARMAEAHGRWGEKHYGDVEGVAEIAALTAELVDNLEGSGIPLFVGWRNAPRAASAAGQAAQLMQILPRMEGRDPSGRHDGRRIVTAGGHLDERGPGSGEVLRVGGALPGFRRDHAASRRGRGNHRSALRRRLRRRVG